MAFEEYVQGEIVDECAQGYLTRREALRRLMLLGVGATAAGVMLAGCSDDDESSTAGDTSSTTGEPAGSSTTATVPSAAPVGPAPLATEAVTFDGPAGQLKGSWSAAPTPKGSVLIIHENRGLTPHFVTLPGRLAASGYSALAIDLLSRKGGTGAFRDQAEATAALTTGTPMADLVADLRAGIGELLRRVPGQKVGVVGFCFGGGMTWQLLAAGEDRLAAAAPFYGPLPDPHDFSRAKAAVLAFYGETDGPRVNDGIEPARAALTAAKLPHEIVVAPGAGHAFFNETGQRFNPTAAADAYSRLMDWFGRYLA
jgi:carboxymethylenebutenolidase